MVLSQWKKLIDEEEAKPYFSMLADEVSKQRAAGVTIFPAENDVFNAFKYVDLSEIKVVILGQDPYHGENNGLVQAHGLAFSVSEQCKIPPSLVNIYKELVTDINGFVTPYHGNLTAWAQQGVLLLNTVLTVQQAQAHSHAKLGWELFTDAIVNNLSKENTGCVFMLWGAHAQKKGRNIDQTKHLVLSAPHPSPLSVYRGFYGCRHFSKANNWLSGKSKQPIEW